MIKDYLKFSIIIISIYLILQLLGFFSKSGVNWGFHFLAFTPIYFTVIYFVLVIVTFIFISKKPELKFIDKLEQFLKNKPHIFLLSFIVLFISLMIILRMNIPLLGDGFYIVKNFSNALSGVSPPDPRNEPLSTYYFWGIVKLLKVSSYENLLNVFLIGEILLAIPFIITTFYLTKVIFKDPQEHLLSFLFIISAPYIQLFFGYIETYSVVLLVVAMYLLTSFLYLRQKASFLLPSIIFLVLFLTHYLSLLLLPSLVYLGYRDYRNRGIKNIISAIGILVLLILILSIIIKFNFERFYAWVPHSHFLPLTFSSDFIERYTEPYTLFSFFHAVDLFNYIILLASGALCFLIISYFKSHYVLFKSVESKFFLSALLPLLIFISILKFDLGMAKDWDIFASYFIILSIYSLYVFFQANIEFNRHIIFLTLIITGLSTLSYLLVNSSKEASIKRYETLLDNRLLSNYGHYSATLSLALYYHQINDTKSAVETWEQYTHKIPSDPQGFRNVITNAKNLGVEGIKKTLDAYERYLKAVPQDTIAIAEYSAYCIDMGNLMFSQGALTEAKMFYGKVILLTPYYERGYNNLGSVYAQEGKSDTAIHYFNKAIELDSNYSDPYYNLGTIYEEQGNNKKALEFFKHAAKLNNKEAIEKLKQLPLKK